jgi:hypothetical protein
MDDFNNLQKEHDILFGIPLFPTPFQKTNGMDIPDSFISASTTSI